jgi:hypothetical protein
MRLAPTRHEVGTTAAVTIAATIAETTEAGAMTGVVAAAAVVVVVAVAGAGFAGLEAASSAVVTSMWSTTRTWNC